MALRDVVREEAERHHGTVTYSNDMYEAYVPRDIEAIKNMKMYVTDLYVSLFYRPNLEYSVCLLRSISFM